MLTHLDDPHPPAPSPTLAGAVMAKGRRRLRRRMAIAGLAAFGLIVLASRLEDEPSDVVAALGEPPSESSTVPSPATEGSSRRSPQVPVDGTPTVLVAYVEASGATGTTGRIDVLEWRDSWRTVGSFDGVVVSTDASRPLLTEDVTGDGEPDFVVPLEAASTAPYQVVSNDGGSWRQVPFGATNRIMVTDPDDPRPDRFVTSSNLCEPTCAAGRYRRESWRYAAAEGMYLRVETAVCDAISEVEWRCDPAESTLATEHPIGSDETSSTMAPPSKHVAVEPAELVSREAATELAKFSQPLWFPTLAPAWTADGTPLVLVDAANQQYSVSWSVSYGDHSATKELDSGLELQLSVISAVERDDPGPTTATTTSDVRTYRVWDSGALGLCTEESQPPALEWTEGGRTYILILVPSAGCANDIIEGFTVKDAVAFADSLAPCTAERDSLRCD